MARGVEMSRFVRPDVTVLKISNGDTLTVKSRLNHGEQTASYARLYLAGVDGRLRVNPLETGKAMVTAYLLDWSFTDDSGKVVVIRDQPIDVVSAALDALSPEDFAEVKAAIEEHDEKMAKARADAKKLQGTENESPAISPSPESVTGDSTTFASSTPTTTTS